MKPRNERLESTVFGCQRVIDKLIKRIEALEARPIKGNGIGAQVARGRITRYRQDIKCLEWNRDNAQKKLKQV